MKIFSFFIKYVVAPLGTVAGLFYGFDTYVIGRAKTVVEPFQNEVLMFKEHTKEHQERVERELIMLRSQNDEIKTLIIKYK